MADDRRGAVRAFFAEKGKKIPSDATDLFEAEIIDSLELMELLLHLEERHGIAVAQELMTADNFRSVDAIVRTLDVAVGVRAAPR
jgi:acyl carrier protein